MSDATTTDSQELLIAKSPTGVHIIMGLRGATARDLVGEMDAAIGWMPRWLMADLSDARPGLHVWAGTIENLPHSEIPVAFRGTGVLRPAVLGDLPRFGLQPLLPRNPEGSEARSSC